MIYYYYYSSAATGAFVNWFIVIQMLSDCFPWKFQPYMLRHQNIKVQISWYGERGLVIARGMMSQCTLLQMQYRYHFLTSSINVTMFIPYQEIVIVHFLGSNNSRSRQSGFFFSSKFCRVYESSQILNIFGIFSFYDNTFYNIDRAYTLSDTSTTDILQCCWQAVMPLGLLLYIHCYITTFIEIILKKCK